MPACRIADASAPHRRQVPSRLVDDVNSAVIMENTVCFLFKVSCLRRRDVYGRNGANSKFCFGNWSKPMAGPARSLQDIRWPHVMRGSTRVQCGNAVVTCSEESKERAVSSACLVTRLIEDNSFSTIFLMILGTPR